MPAPSLEIWGGIECTVNRVRERFFDQVIQTGHHADEHDLDRFSALGFRTLRYPILWERVAPRRLEDADWRWCDRRLERLRALGIAPVAGLMHHGSGPAYTSLVDPRFPDLFERYAAAVAERYPWIERWIPFNEPLTTARFSCLYGHWYPHARDNRLFARAMVNECIATVRGMRAIRRAIPHAVFIQSEDLGKTFSTPLLAYQACHDNERRWLTFDLLCGRVTPGHPMWEWLCRAGEDADRLQWLADNPLPPDRLGVNHYLTSERFLDEREERYPLRWRGGNSRHRYADVEAVRVCAEGPAGLEPLLRETWDRFQIPIVITEVHLDCTREEQLRWLVEVGAIAERLRGDGQVTALTVWSLLGSYNWNELMMVDGGYYEPGVFDIRGGARRETALARVVRRWTTGADADHAVLGGTGWWRRNVRFLYEPVTRGAPADPQPISRPTPVTRKPLLLLSRTPSVARDLGRAAHLRDLAVVQVTERDCDRGQVDELLAAYAPWAIVIESGLDVIGQPNVPAGSTTWANAAAALAARASTAGAHVTLLSGQRLCGSAPLPVTESDTPHPYGRMGRWVRRVERDVHRAAAACLLIRTATGFTARDDRDESAPPACALPKRLAPDAPCSLTYLPDLIRVLLDLAIDGESGVWHLSNRGHIATVDMWKMAGCASPEGTVARQQDGATYQLRSRRADLLPRLEDALRRAGYSSTAPSCVSAARCASDNPVTPAIFIRS